MRIIKTQLLSERETAVYIGMSVGFLRQSRMNGKRENHTVAPPYIKIGRTVRYSITDLDEWINKNRIDK